MSSFELLVDLTTFRARVRIGNTFIHAEALLNDPSQSAEFKNQLRSALRKFGLLNGEVCYD